MGVDHVQTRGPYSPSQDILVPPVPRRAYAHWGPLRQCVARGKGRRDQVCAPSVGEPSLVARCRAQRWFAELFCYLANGNPFAIQFSKHKSFLIVLTWTASSKHRDHSSLCALSIAHELLLRSFILALLRIVLLLLTIARHAKMGHLIINGASWRSYEDGFYGRVQANLALYT